MSRLSHSDYARVLDSIRELYTPGDLDDYPKRVMKVLASVVPNPCTSYTELNPALRRALGLFDDDKWKALADPNLHLFQKHMHQHPILHHFQQVGDGAPVKISDFMSLDEWKATDVWRQFYRLFGFERQMVVCLPVQQPLVVGVALNREKIDFSERDRLALNLLRPHLYQAYYNAAASHEYREELGMMRQADESLHRGLISVTDAGDIVRTTPTAERMLAAFFPRDAGSNGHLPEDLRRWSLAQIAALRAPESVRTAPRPLQIDRGDRRLTGRVITHVQPTRFVIVLEEQGQTIDPRRLAPLGLTTREAEVLHWVAQGKTNPEIGMILSLSARTVQKHLERIFQKLGVETRTAAALRAHEAQRG